jgi:hypothetical protein
MRPIISHTFVDITIGSSGSPVSFYENNTYAFETTLNLTVR